MMLRLIEVQKYHYRMSINLLKLVDVGAIDFVLLSNLTSAWWYRTGLNGSKSISVKVKANKPTIRAIAWCAY